MKNYKSIITKTKPNLILFIIILLIFSGYIVFALAKPFPALTPLSDNITSPTFSGNFNWPNYGQSAIGSQDFGVLATNGEQTSRPVASIAKTILALAVLTEKPLNINESGPNIAITQNDIDLYKEAIKQNGSNVPVALGENLSEYQALQALLIPSGDNIAETLAIWAFGSQQKYLDYANNMVADWGLTQTHLADASGLSPQTVSSAHDLIVIGQKTLASPVLVQIVSQQEVDLPIVGKVKNYNTLLGQNGVNGIKTGNTNEAGGCLLFSYNQQIDQKNTTLIGIILGAPNRYQALIDTSSFIKSNVTNYKYSSVIKKDQIIGSVNTPWGSKINILAKDELSLLTVPEEKIEIEITLNNIKSTKNKNDVIGQITVRYLDNSKTVPAILAGEVAPASIIWKLLHP